MKFLTTDLEDMSWLRHGFFTRMGGVSSGLYNSLNCGMRNDDKPANVAKNRARVAETFGLSPENLLIAKQVHGIKVATAAKPWDGQNPPEADAIVTDKKGLAIGVLTADCVPVLFADRKKKIVGAAHAGWRGALAGVIEETLAAMIELGAKPENIEAAIGPCIGPKSYEVKDDFRDAFLAQDKGNGVFFRPSPRAGHLLFDLPGYCTHRLKLAGVAAVHNTHQDTLTGEATFFSNRRAFLKSEKGFGLQVSVIAIT